MAALGASALLAVAILGSSPGSSHYRLLGSGLGLYAALYNDVEDGMAAQDIQKMLGLGEAPEDFDVERHLVSVRRLAERFPSKFPDGVKEGDGFLFYPCGEYLMVDLQLRDGRLINHNRDTYGKYEDLGSIVHVGK